MDEETQNLTTILQREGFAPEPNFSLGEMKNIPLEIDVRLDLLDEQIAVKSGRNEALTGIEWGIQLLATDLIRAFNETQYLVLEAGAGWGEERSLFPWIPWYDRNVHMESNRGYLKKLLDLDQSLIDQRLDGQNERIISIVLQSAISLEEMNRLELLIELDLYDVGHHQPLFKTELASIVIESVAFAEGSLRGSIMGTLRVLGLTIPLLTPFVGPAVTPPFAHWYEEQQFEKKIEMTVLGQPCTVYSTWKYDVESLRQASIEELNFASPGLSESEKRNRICNVQVALKLEQGSPDKIDGLWGPASKEALAHFARTHRVPADIKSEALRGELHQVFLNRKVSK